MCGLAGIISAQPMRMARPLSEMGAAIAHRGPDDLGYGAWRSVTPIRTAREPIAEPSNVGVVHRRLSIIELSDAGWQPMQRPETGSAVVFNGEIYNYLELGQELRSRGVDIRSGSDTEVLLAALDHWGLDCLPRLNGMFAFVWLDPRSGTVTLVRDRFGIKPLFLSRKSERIVFASEIPSLLRSGLVSADADPQSVYDYLVHGVNDHGTRTFLAEVEHLPPGHAMTVSVETAAVLDDVRYWSPPRRDSDLGFEEAAEAVRESFLDSVRLHLRSDVPLGAALSGGIDSSAVVGATRHLLGPEADIHTFTFVADDPALSESHWVDEVVAATAVIRHDVFVAPNDLIEDLPMLIERQGEPFGSTSIYAQHRVFRAAREAGIKVMLDGQGADELLAGYTIYDAPRLASLVRQGRLSDAWRFSRRVASLPGTTSLARLPLLLGASYAPDAAWRAWEAATTARSSKQWLDVDWFEQHGVDRRLLRDKRYLRTLPGALEEALTRLQLPALLRYDDRNSMAASIESRVPFLSTDFAELVMTLPVDHLFSLDGERKSVFRKAMRGLVPDVVLDRKDKIGFATPERSWLAALDPWVEETLLSARGSVPIDVDSARNEWRRVLSGSARFDWRVWRWINLITWADRMGVRF